MAEKQKIVSGTAVKRCNCKHEFQDSRYGTGLRVHNVKKDGAKATCTVCGKEN